METKGELHKSDAGEYKIPFGIHKGTKLKDLPDSYLYFLSQGNCYGKIKEYTDDNIEAIIANVNKNRHYNKATIDAIPHDTRYAEHNLVMKLSDEEMKKIVK
jgi:uncharacterized protein (DUF3820 family)